MKLYFLNIRRRKNENLKCTQTNFQLKDLVPSLSLFSCLCILSFVGAFNWKLHFGASGCFSNANWQQQALAKQIRFPRKRETSFVGEAFIHSLLTMRYSRFPPQIYYLQTIPRLDTSQFEMQSHLLHTGQGQMVEIVEK